MPQFSDSIVFYSTFFTFHDVLPIVFISPILFYLGAEYIIDLERIHKKRDVSETKRVYLLRPFTKLEALPMPAATEQKGIHLVLPVLK